MEENNYYKLYLLSEDNYLKEKRRGVREIGNKHWLCDNCKYLENKSCLKGFSMHSSDGCVQIKIVSCSFYERKDEKNGINRRRKSNLP